MSVTYPTSSLAYSSITGRPLWVSVILFWSGMRTTGVETDFISGGSQTSTTWVEPASYFGDSAAVAMSTPPAYRKTIDFSKLGSIGTAYFQAVLGVAAVSITDINARLYNVTNAVAITNSTGTKTSPVADTDYEVTSADCAANLPTASKEMTFQVMQTSAGSAATLIGRAELIVYWN